MKSVLANASHNEQVTTMPFYYNLSLRNWQEENMGMWFICVRFYARGTALAEPLAFLFSLGNKNKRKKEVWMDIRSQNLAIVLKIPGKRFCLLFTCR